MMTQGGLWAVAKQGKKQNYGIFLIKYIILKCALQMQRLQAAAAAAAAVREPR